MVIIAAFLHKKAEVIATVVDLPLANVLIFYMNCHFSVSIRLLLPSFGQVLLSEIECLSSPVSLLITLNFTMDSNVDQNFRIFGYSAFENFDVKASFWYFYG